MWGCGLFLPNRDLTPEALRPGIGVAAPDRMAALLRDSSVRLLTF